MHFSERVPQKSLAQNVLVPALAPTLIARNTANIKGRGLSAALAGLKRDMARHWRAHGAQGWVLLVDFHHYFDSIAHGPLKAQLRAALDDGGALRLAEGLVDLQGQRGLGLGCEPNQIEAVAFPNRLDHLTCEVLRPEGHGRYMDDAYLIDASKERLLECLARWEEEAAALDGTVHGTTTGRSNIMSDLTEAQLSAEIAGLEQLLEAGDVEVLRALEPLLRCTTADEVVEALATAADDLGGLVEQRAAWAETLADYQLQLEALTSDGTADTDASDDTETEE